MVIQAERDEQGVAALGNCTQQLEEMIAALARVYGVAAVIAALTEVVGCVGCAGPQNRTQTLRSLLRRIGASR